MIAAMAAWSSTSMVSRMLRPGDGRLVVALEPADLAPGAVGLVEVAALEAAQLLLVVAL
jgi:hypothetical protein